MRNELIIIHNNLMKMNVSGENAICVADSIIRLRRVIDSLPEKEDESETE